MISFKAIISLISDKGFSHSKFEIILSIENKSFRNSQKSEETLYVLLPRYPGVFLSSYHYLAVNAN